MKTRDRQNGQTLIETVFVLTLILLILFGIAEFARAWFLKNSLNNAARIGVRFAVVHLDSGGHGNLIEDDQHVKDVVRESPGIPGGIGNTDPTQNVTVEVFICKADEPDCDASEPVADKGDIIRVTVTINFLKSDGVTPASFSVFSGLIPGLSEGLTSLAARASMRYEL